jgi:hypothetical protein
MAEEAKASEMAAAAGAQASKPHVGETSVNRYTQSSDPIPKVKPPRGSKDARSFRPSTMKEVLDYEEYHPLVANCGGKEIPYGCGQDAEDWLIIFFCFISLWSFIIMFYVLLLKAALDTVLRHTALWMYFWLFLIFSAFLAAGVLTGQVVRKRREAELIMIEKEVAAEAAAEDVA